MYLSGSPPLFRRVFVQRDRGFRLVFVRTRVPPHRKFRLHFVQPFRGFRLAFVRESGGIRGGITGKLGGSAAAGSRRFPGAGPCPDCCRTGASATFCRVFFRLDTISCNFLSGFLPGGRRRPHVRPVQNLPVFAAAVRREGALSPHGRRSESGRNSVKDGARGQVGIPASFPGAARNEVGIPGDTTPERRTKTGRISPVSVPGLSGAARFRAAAPGKWAPVLKKFSAGGYGFVQLFRQRPPDYTAPGAGNGSMHAAAGPENTVRRRRRRNRSAPDSQKEEDTI